MTTNGNAGPVEQQILEQDDWNPDEIALLLHSLSMMVLVDGVLDDGEVSAVRRILKGIRDNYAPGFMGFVAELYGQGDLKVLVNESRVAKKKLIFELVHELSAIGGENQAEKAMLFRMRKFLEIRDAELGYAHLPKQVA